MSICGRCPRICAAPSWDPARDLVGRLKRTRSGVTPGEDEHRVRDEASEHESLEVEASKAIDENG
jgi:hypothetical protein